MAWLGSWAKRIEITLESTVVDATLADFPALVYLSTSSGINDEDVSSVFDELASDANRTKIAITKADGTTQQYVDIERWDDASEKAWLWTKVPSLSSSADTIIYLYYDSAQGANTSYVGDTGSTPAKLVWSEHTVVYHMEDATTSTVLDAGSNGFTMTKKAANEPEEDISPGIIGNSQLYASPSHADADYMKYDTDAAALRWNQDVTYEAWWYPTADTGQKHLFMQGSTSNNDSIRIFLFPPYRLYLTAHAPNSTATDFYAYTVDNVLTANAWNHVAFVRDGGTGATMYVDGVAVSWATTSNLTSSLNLGGGYAAGSLWFQRGLWIGGSNTGVGGIAGNLDEFRADGSVKTVEWINTSYETQRDALISNFAAEETGSFGWSGGSVNTVASAAIAKISTVAIGDIASVNGVT